MLMEPAIERKSERRLWIEILVASAIVAAIGVAVVTFATHVLGPALFTHYDRFPALADVPKITRNAKGADGDPVNVAIVAGSDAELSAAFHRAGWVEAQAVTRASSIGIAKSVLLGRPDSSAPVSPLFLFGRQQDHAFEREVGKSASRRHHVRLWRVANLDYHGRPVWIGDASFDERAGLSHRGLHPTHHIDPDVDTERDAIEADLARALQVVETFHVTGYGLRVRARNAEGDRFDTDGEMLVIVLTPPNTTHPPPELTPDPWRVAVKQRCWALAHEVARGVR
jgi:LssY-like putative type I secretion system component LssY